MIRPRLLQGGKNNTNTLLQNVKDPNHFFRFSFFARLRGIAASVIGGSLSDGEGSVVGTLIGSLTMSVLKNGCTHAGTPNASQ